MKLKHNVYFKMGMIFIIIIILLIPATLIKSLISEREQTQRTAINEVSSKWANAQTLKGPIISIPYFKYIKRYSEKDSTEKVIQTKNYLHLLPQKLNIDGDIFPERRQRGIYEVVVYNSKIGISGHFGTIDFESFGIETKDILFDKAQFVIGISDLRGIEKQINLNWNGSEIPFNTGVSSYDVVSSGIFAPLNFEDNKSLLTEFNFDLDLKGSQQLYFTPVGKTTDVNISSSWKNPSFNGAFLPDNRTVDIDGFDANWNVLHLNRNYPQSWQNSSHKIDSSSFGIDLLLPVDNYQKSYRSIKYAILFIVFTFLVFFFIEALNKIFIHPIQYILVGFALIVFYSLLLAVSEHLKFNYAFIISAIATLLLIAGYVRAILKSAQLTLLITGILSILYGFIFVIIQLQDYALLIGSIGIFVILGLVMYFSRKIDWYDINLKSDHKDKNHEINH